MITTVCEFLLWTALLYWMHRLVHRTPILKDLHMDHHKVVNRGEMGWHWNNLFLFNDTWKSTADLWVTEVIPTAAYCLLTGAWWVAVFYYLWAAFVQERVEHDPNFDLIWVTSGRWHMEHHKRSRYNYGAFVPMWDILFDTYADTPYSS